MLRSKSNIAGLNKHASLADTRTDPSRQPRSTDKPTIYDEGSRLLMYISALEMESHTYPALACLPDQLDKYVSDYISIYRGTGR